MLLLIIQIGKINNDISIVMGKQCITPIENFMQQFKQFSETSIGPYISCLDVK